MYRQIGKKVKGLARTLGWIGILGSIASGIVLYVYRVLPVYWCALIGVGGALIGYLSSWVLYAIGDTNERMERIESIVTPKPSYMDYIQEVRESRNNQKCEMCGKAVSELIPAKLVDQMGTRYRRVCRECFAAQPFELDEREQG